MSNAEVSLLLICMWLWCIFLLMVSDSAPENMVAETPYVPNSNDFCLERQLKNEFIK